MNEIPYMMENTSDEFERVRNFAWPPAPVTMEFEMTEVNRPAMEMLFNLCLKCTERRRNCTCHDDGKGYN